MRSEAGGLMRGAGSSTAFAQSALFKAAGKVLLAAGFLADVAEGVGSGHTLVGASARATLSTGLALGGAAAGGALCATETVATSGIGIVACPALIGGLSAAGATGGDIVGDIIATVAIDPIVRRFGP